MRILTKENILQLYKNIYKYGLQLKYTDRDFFNKYIRNQFQNKDIENDTEKINRLYKVRKLN